jgi:lycopene beta-cyclase
MKPTHDIILIGGGCSSIQWLELYRSRYPESEKRILVIDKNSTPPNRTWCFWEEEPHFFSDLVSHRWANVRFASGYGEVVQNISPLTYQYISGSSFFDRGYTRIKKERRTEFVVAEVEDTRLQGDVTEVRTTNGVYSAPQVYSSIPDFTRLKAALTQDSRDSLWQHFRGWFVTADAGTFDPDTVTLMDFRTEQTGGAVFLYVLPFSDRKALVECTVFGSRLWENSDYDARIEEYINRYLTSSYRVTHAEQGKIPMTLTDFTDFAFEGTQSIGTAAGSVKPSTGYMFRRSLRTIENLLEGNNPRKTEPRFAFYDALLLGIIREEPHRIAGIMHCLFSRNDFRQVFRFLSEETSLKEDFRMFSTLPYSPFLKQLVKYPMRGSKTEGRLA